MNIRHGLAVLLASLMFTGSAVAQTSTEQASAKQAFEIAVRCFLANGLAKRNRLKQGDAAGVAAYETKSEESFGVAEAFSKRLGYSRSQFRASVTAMEEPELKRMMTEPGYFKSVMATCKAAKLM